MKSTIAQTIRRSTQRILSLLLILALLCAALPPLRLPARAADEVSGVCGDSLSWSFNPADGVLAVEGSGEMYDYSYSQYDDSNPPPWKDWSDDILELRFGENVDSVGAYAFAGCVNLSTVSFPTGLKKIGDMAFCNCASLKELTLPNDTCHISSGCFSGTAFWNDPSNWEGGVLYCGNWALDFSHFDQHRSVVIRNGTVSLADFIFYGGESGAIDDIVLPEGLKYIGEGAFSLSSIREISLPESIVDFTRAFYGATELERVHLPSNLTEIPDHAFNVCESLREINFPQGLKRIGTCAFRATALKDVVLPASLEYIGWGGFCNDESMGTITFRGNKTQLAVLFEKDFCEDTGEDVFSPSIFYCTLPPDTVVFYHPEGESPNGEIYDERFNEGGLYAYCRDFNVSSAVAAYGLKGYSLDGFSDVSDTAYYAKPVAWAVGNGITSGTGTGLFSPKKTCTREQVMAFLYAAEDKPGHTETESPFTDVTPGKYFYHAVMWAVENNVTSGVSKTRFGVGKPCTREQVVAFLWKAAGSPEPESAESPFTDVTPGKYYYKAVLWANENKITGGVGGGKFGVGKACTRAQIVTFLYKAYGTHTELP